MMMVFKGILISAAGPAPNYDMQRVLATKGPREAALMSSTVNVVLFFPRYMLITGLTVLALAFYSPNLAAMGKDMDVEKILPLALAKFVPVGILGLTMAGLIAAFMSNFAATVNAAPGVSRQRHLQAVHQSQCPPKALCVAELYRLLLGGRRRPYLRHFHAVHQLGRAMDRVRPVGWLHRF